MPCRPLAPSRARGMARGGAGGHEDSSGDQLGSVASVGVTIWRSLKPAMSIIAMRAE